MALPDVLVTGSAGHLGHALMLELPSYGFTPFGIDILNSDHTSAIGSVVDRDFISSVFKDHPSLCYVLHTAALHKPHVESHSKEALIETNIKGTLILLEEASKTNRIDAFIFTSTTSTFGAALAPKPGQPAAWIDETIVPKPKNIYGTTKTAAEDLCQLIHDESKMPVLVLKTSRFFPEPDDNEAARKAFGDDNLKVCELLYRRVDIADVVLAHVCAMREAKRIGWAKYVISAPPPFDCKEENLKALNDGRAGDIIRQIRPRHTGLLLQHGWKLPANMDRVYDSSKAIRELGWQPFFTFEQAVECVGGGRDWRSDLSVRVGKRGYHTEPTGVYTA